MREPNLITIDSKDNDIINALMTEVRDAIRMVFRITDSPINDEVDIYIDGTGTLNVVMDTTDNIYKVAVPVDTMGSLKLELTAVGIKDKYVLLDRCMLKAETESYINAHARYVSGLQQAHSLWLDAQ